MTLSIRTDTSYAEGGYALLEGPDLDEVTAIAVESCASGQFLGEDGRWKKAPFSFPVETTPSGGLSIGPHVVDLIPTELLIVVHAQDGRRLGQLFWTDILPSRNPGSAVSEHTLEERRQGEEEAAEQVPHWKEVEAIAEQAAEEIAEQAAEDVAFQEEVKTLARQAAAEIAGHAVVNAEQEGGKPTDDAAAQTSARGDEEPGHASRFLMQYWVAAALLVLVLGGFIAVAPGLHDHSESQAPRQDARPIERPAPASVPTPPTPDPPAPQGPQLVPRGNQKASFPCQPSMSEPVAQLICHDRELAAADWRLGIALKAAMRTRGAAGRRTLMAEERAWLPQRNELCGIPTEGERDADDLAQFKECLLREIERRADEIERRL